MNMDVLLYIALMAIPIIIAITFHEAAHGFVARALGDDTAEHEGRVTLNPLKHIDPWGTLLLPAVLLLTLGVAFGYAKPVPVDARRLHHPKRDMAFVAAAGPLMNIALAIVFAVLLVATQGMADTYPLWGRAMELSIVINFILALLNLIPLPPLDGSKVLAALLPPFLAAPYQRLEAYGFLLVVMVLIVVPIVSARMGWAFDPAEYLVTGPAYYLSYGLMEFLGVR
ncbi:MAG: hypothetical protein RJB62_468 [Pseudomonadota bacterium]